MGAVFEFTWTLLAPMIHVAAFLTAVIVVLLTAILDAVRPKRRHIIHSDGNQLPNDDNQPGSGHAELVTPRERAAGTQHHDQQSQRLYMRRTASFAYVPGQEDTCNKLVYLMIRLVAHSSR